jgi:hypothetical protein
MRNVLAPAMARKPRIDVRLEGDSNEYTTGDRIHGKVVIESNVETHFDTIEIKLMGQSKTFVDPMSALPGIQEVSKGSRTFLTLRQPGLESLYPINRTLQRGMIYEFPFEFVLPKRLVDGSCSHRIASPAIREAHSALPPSFNRHHRVGKGGDVDSTIPETTAINYGIMATIFKDDKLNANRDSAAMTTMWREILVTPCTSVVLPADLRKTTSGSAPSDHCLRSVQKMSKGIIRSRLGTVTVEAAPPKRLKVQQREEESSHRFCTVPVNVKLRFDNKNLVAEAPQVSKITSRLEINTFYTTSSHQELPRKNDGIYYRNRRVYTKHLPYTTFTPEKVVWESVSAKGEESKDLNPAPAYLEIADCEQNLATEPSPIHSDSSRTTNLVVPVNIPVPTTLVPTFHSCLISRTYILEMSIKLTTQGCSRTANLRLPLQVSLDTGDRFVEFLAGSQAVMDSLLPAYLDDGSTSQANAGRTHTNEDMEDILSIQQPVSLAYTDSPPAYCVYL